MKGWAIALAIGAAAAGAAIWSAARRTEPPSPPAVVVQPPAPSVPATAPTAGDAASDEDPPAAARSQRWTGTCTLRGRATRPDGTPWHGVASLADRDAEEGDAPPTVRTDPDGTFRFEGLPRAPVRLVARFDDGSVLPGPVVLLPCDEVVPFVVGGGLVEIEGRVVAAAGGAPVAGAALRFDEEAFVQRTTSDAEGRFRIRALATDDAELHAEAPGFLPGSAPVGGGRRPSDAPVELRLPRTGSLEILATDRDTGRAVPGVLVRFEDGSWREDSTATTDATGRCTITGLRPGRVEVFAFGGGWISRELATPEGLDPDAWHVTVPDGRTAQHELLVVPAPRVRGRVLDEAGNGVPAVNVWAILEVPIGGRLGLLDPMGVVGSGADGSFEFPEAFPGAALRFQARREDWPLALGTLPPLQPGEVGEVTLHFPEERRPEVRVVDVASGAPLPRTPVRLQVRMRERETWHFDAGTTGDDGSLLLPPMPAFPVRVSVSSIHGRVEGASAEVGPGDLGPVVLAVRLLDEPRDLAIEGVVTMPDGTPAVAAEWNCSPWDEYTTRCFERPALADFRGRFRAEGLAAGPHRLSAEIRRGGRTFRGEAKCDAGATDAVVRLEDVDRSEAGLVDGNPLRFRVLGPDGAPVHAGQVDLVMVSGEHERRERARLFEGACGFAGPAEPGLELWVDVLHAEGADGKPLPLAHGRFGPFPAAPGEREIRLRPELAIAGRVVDAEGRGVPEVEVTVTMDETAESNGSSRTTPIEESVRTDADGRFRVGRLGDFLYDVELDPGPKFVPPMPRKVRGGSDRVVEELRSAVAILFTVLGPDGRPLESARVRAWPDEGRGASGRTDAAGKVRLAGLDPEADHAVSVDPPDGREDLLEARVEIGRPVDTTVRLERGHEFRVAVRDPMGRRLAGVSVALSTGPGGDEDRRTEATDDEGIARFTRVPAGPVRIEAGIEGLGGFQRGAVTAAATAEQGRAELVLDPGGEAVVRVKGWDAEEFGLAYFARDADREPTQAAIGDDGVVRLRGLAAGASYNVYLRSMRSGESRALCALVRGVRVGDPVREVELVEGRDIRGKVILPAGADGFAVAALLGETVLFDGFPRAEDTFVLPGMPEGNWTVVVYLTTADGKYHAATATAPAGGSVEIRVP